MPTEYEKLLIQIDSRFSEYGRRIAEFENQIIDLKSIAPKYERIATKHADFVNDQQSLNIDLSKRTVAQEKHALFVEEKIAALSANFDRFNVVLNQFLSNFNDVKKSFLDVNDKIVVLQEKIERLSASHSESLEKIRSSEEQKKQIESSIASLKEEIGEAGNRHEEILSKLQPMQVYVSKHSSDINNISILIEKIDKKIEESCNEISQKMGARIASMDWELQKRISSIIVPDVSAFIDKGALLKMEHEIELASLDAKNAYLKANNNEMQNQILSKKIDGLQILQKSFEYSNGK